MTQRSIKQNSSAHLWFTHIADTFNEHGLDIQAVLEKRVGFIWTPEAVKEVLFKGAMKYMYPTKTSTTQLTTKEFATLAESLQAAIARDYGLDIDIPSQETLERKERVWR